MISHLIRKPAGFVASLACVMLSACGEQNTTDNPDSVMQEADVATTRALPKSDSPDGARVFFVSPENAAVVTSPVRIEFGADGMSIAKAGEQRPNSGHHHLLINTDLPNPDLPIPADSRHIHFGDGSTSTEIELEPGEYTLQLLLGDYLHIPHNPPVVSQPITITVE